MVIFVYDIRHKIIPDGLSFLFALLALAHLVFVHGSSVFTTLPGIFDFLIGPLMALAFFGLWYFSKGTWIGLGDAKLVIGIGWMLGFVSGISAVIVGFWAGALVSIILLSISTFKISKKKYMHGISMRTEIPFAPFLIIGLLLVFFFKWDVLYLNDIFTLFN